jgi:predicted RNA polymerase sigma factor
MSDNPMVSLNHAIAVAMVHGPSAGLDLLDELEEDVLPGRGSAHGEPSGAELLDDAGCAVE